MERTIKSPEEMVDFAKELIKKWHNKFLLIWELWAGKTHFSKWVAIWLWLNDYNVQSPTYTYLNIYEDTLLHIDMYRLEESEDALQKWIFDAIDNYDNICIEWPKFTEYYVDNDWIKLEIKKVDENTRTVKY